MSDKEQQIKEMTQDFINFGITTRQGVEAFAEILYNAGYRKISEDNICEAVEKPVNTPKRKYESIEDIVRGFVKMSNKEQQIEEIEQFIYDYVDSKQTERVYLLSSRVNELAKPFVHNKGLAEALYNAGYRKTFTSDFASDTQKAYKEGYIKGIEETEAEIEILKIQNKNRGYQPLPITPKPAPPKGLTPSPKSISIDTVKEMNAMCDIDEQRKQAVKEFAEWIKDNITDIPFCNQKAYNIFCDMVNEKLKEYEAEA